MDQLFAASTNVINTARRAAEPFDSPYNERAAMDDLRAALYVFDRLNGGL
jgi:hypothetical protein